MNAPAGVAYGMAPSPARRHIKYPHRFCANDPHSHHVFRKESRDILKGELPSSDHTCVTAVTEKDASFGACVRLSRWVPPHQFVEPTAAKAGDAAHGHAP